MTSYGNQIWRRNSTNFPISNSNDIFLTKLIRTPKLYFVPRLFVSFGVPRKEPGYEVVRNFGNNQYLPVGIWPLIYRCSSMLKKTYIFKKKKMVDDVPLCNRFSFKHSNPINLSYSCLFKMFVP